MITISIDKLKDKYKGNFNHYTQSCFYYIDSDDSNPDNTVSIRDGSLQTELIGDIKNGTKTQNGQLYQS